MNVIAIRDEVQRTETALILPSGLGEDEWRAAGEQLGTMHRASAWWIGDWINYGEAKWGEKYTEAQEITGLAYSTLRIYAHTSSRFPIVARRNKLSFQHHRVAAALPSAEQRNEILAEAEENDWSRAQLRAELAPQRPTKISPQRRHQAVIDAADVLATRAEKWERAMTDTLTPPQARKQLTVLRKAHEQLAEVIDAVEYRAATLTMFRR